MTDHGLVSSKTKGFFLAFLVSLFCWVRVYRERGVLVLGRNSCFVSLQGFASMNYLLKNRT